MENRKDKTHTRTISRTDLQIKISVEAQLSRLRAMETQFTRQIATSKLDGDIGTDSLKKLFRDLCMMRRRVVLKFTSP